MLSRKPPRIPLPKGWTKHARSAVLHVISLAQYAAVYSRSWAVDSMNGRVRLCAELDRAHQEIALLREALRIKDARMAQIAPLRRPHYPPAERMAILELRARSRMVAAGNRRAVCHGILHFSPRVVASIAGQLW